MGKFEKLKSMDSKSFLKIQASYGYIRFVAQANALKSGKKASKMIFENKLLGLCTKLKIDM